MIGPSTNRERATPFRHRRHYFHAASPVGVWRTRLSLLALVAATGWIGFDLLRRERMHADVSHGEVARSHAVWNNRCDACHIPFGEPGCTASSVLDCRERWRAFRCDSCHPGSEAEPKNYAPHYSLDIKQYLKSDPTAADCSSCHRDHQGRDFDLSHVADADCTRCHRDLKEMHRDDRGAPAGEARLADTVTRFDRDHPEFRLHTGTAPIKRSLKFNHGLHLALGIRPTPTDATAVNPSAMFTLDRVDKKFRSEYERFARSAGAESSAIRLDCSACHEPDGGRQLGAAGEYYLPITFEKHCQGCHSLNVTGLATLNGLKVSGFELPHRLQPPAVERLIRTEIVRQIEDREQLLLKTPLPPNDRLDAPPVVKIPSNLRAETDKLVAQYRQLLFDQAGERPSPVELAGGYACMKCHYKSSDGTNIEPTPMRSVWLPAGRFDHSRHRAVNCGECHTTWDDRPAMRRTDPRWTDEAVNIRGIATCQKCHSPTRTSGGQVAGGVRHDCVDCHRYHKTDDRRTAIPANRGLDIDAFLRGSRPHQEGR